MLSRESWTRETLRVKDVLDNLGLVKVRDFILDNDPKRWNVKDLEKVEAQYAELVKYLSLYDKLVSFYGNLEYIIEVGGKSGDLIIKAMQSYRDKLTEDVKREAERFDVYHAYYLPNYWLLSKKHVLDDDPEQMGSEMSEAEKEVVRKKIKDLELVNDYLALQTYFK